jgi:hypothetical protein
MQKNGFLRAAFLLALFAAITYLPLAGQLGFYRDDWHVIWAGMSRGWQAIIDLHLTDRPFMGAYYSLVYVVLGNHPLAWQIYAFSLRLGGALAFLWLLRMLWPRQQLATAIAALTSATLLDCFLESYPFVSHCGRWVQLKEAGAFLMSCYRPCLPWGVI